MEKDQLYQRIKAMITSSTKKPKYVSLSTVKLADILNTTISNVEHNLQELVNEGQLLKSKLTEPPNHDIYLLP
jgi:DNA-binding transcriptional MocR family regulator